MEILGPRVHGYLAFSVVATVSYALAAIHLVLTLLTAFPSGVVKAIPFTVHGALELVGDA
ncbi:MAG: hypothetical protein ACREVJ_00745 [Gammaproteobacteria bacterium]